MPAATPAGLDAIQARLSSPEYAQVSYSLAQIGFNSAVDLMSTFAARAEQLRPWLADAQISPKTRERYAGLIRHQVMPHLGSAILQQLSRDAVKRWHKTLREKGGVKGQALADRTVLHAHG